MKGIQKYRFGFQLLCLILTAISSFISFKTTLLVVMILTLLGGAFYCGWICPYGFIQDIFSKLGAILGIKKRKMPQFIQKILMFSRYILFMLIVFIGSDLVFSIMSLDSRVNFIMLLSGKIATTTTIVIMLSFLLISLFFERPFCNYFCYEGAKYGLISSLRIFTIKRDTVKCVNCKKCDKSCPMNIEVSKCDSLRSLQCINCFQCISTCPIKDTLYYGKTNIKNLKPNKHVAIITTVFLLITTFVGYNIYSRNYPLKKVNKTVVKSSVSVSETPVTVVKSDISANKASVAIAKSDVSTNKASAVVTKSDALVSKVETATVEKVPTIGDDSKLKDGIYTGQGEGFKGTTTVEVTINNHKITKINVLNYSDDRKWFERAYNTIVNEIINTQSADVDLVSGATYSSNGIKDAAKDALAKAK